MLDPGFLCPGDPPCRLARHRRRRAAPSAEGDAHPMSAQRQPAIAADCVFDGTAVHRDAAVVAEGAEIIALVPRADLPAAMPVATLPAGCWLPAAVTAS